MKKKQIHRTQRIFAFKGSCVGKNFFKMLRFTIFYLFIGLSQVFALDSYSQMTKMSLSVSNERLENVLKMIENDSEFFFLYNKDLIDVEQIVDLEVSDKTIDKVLNNLLEGKEIGYDIYNRQIVLYNQKETSNLEIQQSVVTGNVTDEKGISLPGVTIVIKGKAVGTVTNVNGEFQIPADSEDVLVFSFIGFKKMEVPVSGRNVLNIELKPEAQQLDEFVVTALGISRQKKALPYNTQTVSSDELVEVRDANNVFNSLQGKVANALITQSSTGVGGEAQIVLRGNSSINGSNSALIVVDGVPNSKGANINPDDIESMTVLNGSAAAALYGSDAGNGVVVITTKKGQEEEVSIKVNSGLTLNTPFSLPEFQNEYGQGYNGYLFGSQGNSWGAKMEGQEYTNYLGEPRMYSAEPNNVQDFFKIGINANNTISISGGGKKSQGYMSYTNNRVQGIVPNNTIKSHNFNLRLTNQLTDRFSTDAKVTYYTANVDGILRTGEGNTAVLDAYQIPRSVSLDDVKRFETTNSYGVVIPEAYPSTMTSRYQNPYWVTTYDRLSEERSQIFGYISAKFDITNWLSVKGRANIDQNSVLNEQKTNEGTVGMTVNDGGIYTVKSYETTNQWYDFSFDGTNDFSELLKLDYHVGGIYQDKKYTQRIVTANGLNIANKFSTNFATNPVTTQSSTHIQTQSLYALANLAYKNAFYLDASIRGDWDSRLPSPHSYQYYSFGGSAIISEVVELPSYISFLKATASYAEVGNSGEFGLLETTYNYSAGTGNGYLYRSGIYSIPNLKPEIVQSKEFGLEARFFNNRFSAEFTCYKNNSKNQLLTIGVPYATGYSSQYINAGNIENSGFEIVLSADVVKGTKFNWTVDFNAGINKNEVIELSEGLDVVYQGSFTDWGGRPQIAVGGSYGDLVASKWARNDDGEFLVTNNGLPITSGAAGEQPSLIGNFNPDAVLGLTNTFNYRGLSCRILIDGRVGGVAISGTEGNLSHSGITESTLPYREGGWNLGGVNIEGEAVDAEITAQQFWQTVSGKRSATGEFYTYDATNFRIREVSLGYEIPVPEEFIIKSVKLSVVARNLMWLYRGKSVLDIPGLEKRTMWFDPDISLGSTNNFKGIEYGMPSTRSIGFNLSLNF
jgi:TonB-linked SusC/RagA family outer membrane protein